MIIFFPCLYFNGYHLIYLGLLVNRWIFISFFLCLFLLLYFIFFRLVFNSAVELGLNGSSQESLCDKCLPGEVCVALQGEALATCRTPRDPTDPTGCGGLCVIVQEVCQALGDRAFNCHSASQCLEDEWRCNDGLCIPNIKRCDGHMNCYDRSDEQKMS